MQCIIMENTLIKLTLHDETKKRAHDSQIVRAAFSLQNIFCRHLKMATSVLIFNNNKYIFC